MLLKPRSRKSKKSGELVKERTGTAPQGEERFTVGCYAPPLLNVYFVKYLEFFDHSEARTPQKYPFKF